MKRLQIITLVLLTLGILAQPTFARSGCCSYHDGVRSDGCGCNDGTSLSATCAPYYECTSFSSYGSTSYTAPSFEKTYNGATYYSQSSYDTAVAEAEFETNHKQAIQDTFQSILARAPSDTEVQQWFDYSRDIEDIKNALLATDEYKEIVFQKEHHDNIRTAYKEITGEYPTDAELETLAESSRDLNVIKDTITDQYVPTKAETTTQTTEELKTTNSSKPINHGITDTIARIIAGLFVVFIGIILLTILAVPIALIYFVVKAIRKK